MLQLACHYTSHFTFALSQVLGWLDTLSDGIFKAFIPGRGWVGGAHHLSLGNSEGRLRDAR